MPTLGLPGFMGVAMLCKFLITAALFMATASAQIRFSSGSVTFSGTADPATCTPLSSRIFRNTTSNTTKFCSAANTWTVIGSGSGTVTSVSGTALQISVATGTSTPVISIPTNPTLPGTVTATSGFATTGVGATPFLMQRATAAAAAPGAPNCNLRWISGTNANTGKLVAVCGTSATEVTVVDNVGGGLT